MRAALALVLLAGVARADDVAEVGTVLEQVRSIEFVRIDRVDGGTVAGKVEDWIGSGRVNQEVEVRVPESYDARAGTTLISVCEFSGSCPAWVAVDRGAFYVVRGIVPEEGVAPGVVDKVVMEGFSVRKRIAGTLCVRARLYFIDRPGKLIRIESSVDARTGRGMVWGQPFKRPTRATVSVGNGLGPWDTEAMTITVHTRAADVKLAGGPIERAKDGCYLVDLVPAKPLARTPAELQAALAGKVTEFEERVAALGKPEIGRDGQLRFVSKDRVIEAGSLFPPIPGAGPAAALAQAARGGPLVLPVYKSMKPAGTITVK